MTVITILIATAIAAAVSYGLHMMDKDNNTMEKVKRYADKRQGDLDVYFNQQEKRMTANTAALDTKQMQAAAAVKRLEDQIQEFNRIKENLAGDTNAVKNIEEKINAYDAVLNDLINMTARVEENLDLVKKESVVVDKLNERLDVQNKKIADIEKHIPEISKEFAEKNGTQLKAIGNRLLEQYDSHGEKLKADITQIEGSAQKALASFQQEISAVYEEASLKASKLEDEAFTHLSERAQQRSDAYQKEMNASVSELKANLEQTVAKISSDFQAKIAQVQSLIEERSKTVSTSAETKTVDLDKKYNQIYVELSAKFKQKTSEMEEELANKSADVQANLKASTENVVTAMKKNLTELDAKCKTHIDEIAAKYDERMNAMNEKYNKALEGASGKSDTRIVELQQKITQADEKSKAHIDALTAKYQEAVNTIRQRYETALASIDGKNVEVEKKFDEFDSQYTQQITELKAKLEGGLAQTEETAVKWQTAYEEASRLAEENLEKYNSQVQQKIENVKASLADTLTSISRNVTESVQTAENTVARVKEECSTALAKVDEVEPELNEKVQKIDQQIEMFRQQSNEKIEMLNKMLKESGAKIQEACEQQQTVALSEVDKHLSAYKKDLEYRLSKIESSGSQIDLLQNNLEEAMKEVSSRVLAKFDTFTGEQELKQSQFADSLKKNSDQLENDLEIIENKIEELKKTAIGSMSEKLAGFEESFDRNLKTRGDKINDDLATWKNAFDGKITAFTTDYETQRRELETTYNDDFKEKLAAIQAKSDEQAARLAGGIRSTEESVNERVNEIKTLLSNFASEMQAKVEKVDENSDTALKSAMERSQKNIGDQIEKVQNSMLEELKSFEESIQSRQETSTSSIDSALTEFNTWKQQLKHQLDESKQLFNTELEGLREQSSRKVQDAQTYMANEYAEIFDQNTRKISDLSEKADESVAEYENRTKEIVTQLEKMYEQMLKDTEERVRAQNAEAGRKIQDLNAEIQTISENNRNNQSAFVMKMQTDSNVMQAQMSELGKELQAVKSQLSVYEKADQMGKQIDEKISALDDDFQRIDNYKNLAIDLTGQYNQILKLKDEVTRQIDNFDSEKSKVESIGQRYEKLINLSGTIDEKIRALTTTYDDLQSMEVQVRDFQDTLSGIAGRYDRLEQKNEVVDRVLKDVDTTFENLKALEDRLKICSRQAETLPAEIRDVQHNVDELLKNGPKIGDAVAKLDSLKDVLADTENRIETLNSARQGIGRIEARLQELDRNVDGKFQMLHDIVKADVQKNPEKQPNYITPQEREHVKELKRKGWRIEEIAKALNRTINEIELLLELPSE